MPKKNRKKHSAKIGLPPGTIMHIGEKKVQTTGIELIDYDPDHYKISKLKAVEKAFPFKDTPTASWLNITGLHNTELIQKIGTHFEIHPLVLEDIMNTEHRAKVEIYDNYIFVVLKMVTYDSNNSEMNKEQISLILGKHFVISFQERHGDVLDPVRERIKAGKGRIRKSGPDYLFYAIMDVIIDHYFLILENINDEIETLDNIVMDRPDQVHLQRIHYLKKELIEFRKSVWPVREIINDLLREESTLINEKTEIFLKDLHDHILNVSETIDSMRDLVSGLLDTYLTNLSNRMNEVMKVLTIIATIFIPLSFLAGVYGMNFEFIPELKWPLGYFVFWGVVILLTGGMLYYFRRQKWI